MNRRLALSVAVLCGLGSALSINVAMAADAASAGAAPAQQSTPETGGQHQGRATAKKKPQTLQAVQVVGSFRFGRASETHSIAPVDILPMSSQASRGPSFTLSQTLKYLVPSLTTQKTSGDDQQDAVNTISLRGLDSDQTMVLINGKPYEQSALIGLPGAGTNNMASTYYDIDTIPTIAIGDVQVLRDGAAAQYGSGAIAGVVNIVLKNTPGCESATGFGKYTGGKGGDNYQQQLYCGFSLKDGGTISVTGAYQDHQRSNVGEPWIPDVSDRPLIGDAAVINKTFYVNGSIPINGLHFFFDGGMQNRHVSTADFARGGIGSGDIPSRNSAAMYPDGFVPIHDMLVQNRNGTVGVWGLWHNWRVSLSESGGYNRLMNTETHTLNASLAFKDLMDGGLGLSPTVFRAGGISFRQYVTNFDVTRFFADALHGVNVAFGANYDAQNFKIYPGEPASYLDYDPTGTASGGAQGFPGYQPSDATNQGRHSAAAYVDVETDWTDRFRTDQALRYSHYSDFGSTTIGKLAAAYNITKNFMLRGSASTGFQAPSLPQIYTASTVSNFISGELVNTLLAPNGGIVAKTAGIPPLRPAKSVSYTLGLTWKPLANTSVTLDGYRINLHHRIVLSGLFGDDDPIIGGILTDLGVGAAQFIVNGADTKTQGYDLTFQHSQEIGEGLLTSFLAFNHTQTTITSVRPPESLSSNVDDFLPLATRLFITGEGPKYTMILNNEYSFRKWTTEFNVIWYGPIKTGGAANDAVQRYNSKASANVSATYHFDPTTSLTVGGRNIFDVYPTRQNPNITANGYWYESVQFGLNGAAWFVRFAKKF